MSSGITGQFWTNFGWAYNEAMKLALAAAYLIGVLVVIWAVQSLPEGQAFVPALDEARATQPPPVIEVNAVLSLPTATATAIPTMEPPPVATTDVTINYCGTATPGAICQKPPLSTATVTPYPLCSAAEPGQWCRQDDL